MYSASTTVQKLAAFQRPVQIRRSRSAFRDLAGVVVAAQQTKHVWAVWNPFGGRPRGVPTVPPSLQHHQVPILAMLHEAWANREGGANNREVRNGVGKKC